MSNIEPRDPLEGDIDKFVHPDETRTDEQIAYDEKYAVEPWNDDDTEDGINPEDFKKPTTNTYILALEAAVKERAIAQGLSEAVASKVYSATFLLKDSEGNPTDTLQVAISHYQGELSRPGVQGFYLSPVNGKKDAYGRDAKFVRGHFWGCEQPKGPGISYTMSMSYGGGPTESLYEYAEAAIQPDRLAQADLVELKAPPTTPAA